MILDDNRGSSDLDKQIAVLTTQNNILQKEKEFLLETLRENGILTTELEWYIILVMTKLRDKTVLLN